MKDYLHLRCGACELLLDVDCVEAVGFISDDARRDSAGHRLWREQSLPVLDLTVALGMAGTSRQQLVLRDGANHCIVEVGEVLDMRKVDAADWRDFSAVTSEAERFFDRALATADGRCLLRLRLPLVFF